jgi:hypothetical protein
MKYPFLLLIVLLFFSVLSVAQNRPIDSIPFKLEKDNRMYTYVKVNKSDSLYFLIDTGASDMVINSTRLSKVQMTFDGEVQNTGTTGVNKIKSSTKNLFSWGNQLLKNVQFIAIPYPNERWDGVLGLSVLKQYALKIDYDRMQLYLYDKNTFKREKKSKLKIRYINKVPIVRVKVRTIDNKVHSLNLEVDTGSDRIIDISTAYVNKHNLLDVYQNSFATSTVTSSDGNSGVILNNYFTSVTIYNYELYKIPGGLAQINFGIMNSSEIDGIIGNWLLKRFNMTFDFKRDYLYLEPNNYTYTAFYEFLIK